MRTRAVLAAGVTAALLITGCAAPTPAARVHAEVSHLGYPAHSAIQGRAAVVSAKAFCTLLRSGTSYRAAVADAEPELGSRARAEAFITNAISAYCPGA